MPCWRRKVLTWHWSPQSTICSICSGDTGTSFTCMATMALSRYLPILIYIRGRPEDSIYLGHQMETYEKEHGRFWVPTVETFSWGTLDAIGRAIHHLRRIGARFET